MQIYQMYIAGQWKSSEKTTPVINPYNNEQIGNLPQASANQINKAIESADNASSVMEELPAYARADILEKTAHLIEKNSEKMIIHIVTESGKTRKWAQVETIRAIENLKFAANESLRIHGETVPMDASRGSERHLGFWMRFPVGVVAAIPPYNFPLNLVIHKVAPAIAAGNSVVLKPASNTPGPSQLLVEFLLEAGLPVEGINLLFGRGSTVGEAIVKDERVSKITFTGSPPVGRRIKKLSGLKKVTLELGSNSGTIVDKDADLNLAIDRCVMGSFAYSGQICISVQRIYVHQDIFDSFVAGFLDKTKKLKIGDPQDKSTDIGPMISEDEARRVEQCVQDAISAGAKLLSGGSRKGSVFEPTTLTDVTNKMDVICSEVFGPVVSIVPFNSFNEALDKLNDTIYGLQAGIFTKNISNAFDAIKKVNVGGVIINDVPTYRVDHMPYGGNKESGIGREGARFAIEEMTNIKMVAFNL